MLSQLRRLSQQGSRVVSVPAVGVVDEVAGTLVGRRVRVHGIQSNADLNGTCGTAEAWLEDRGRYCVLLDATGTRQALKPCNLEPVAAGSQLRRTATVQALDDALDQHAHRRRKGKKKKRRGRMSQRPGSRRKRKHKHHDGDHQLGAVVEEQPGEEDDDDSSAGSTT